MASRAAPYNMLMRTTLPCSANAVSYHGLGRKFPNAGAVVTAAMLQVDRLTRGAVRLEDIPEAATRLAVPSCSTKVVDVFPLDVETECEAALAAVSGPRRRRLERLERNIGHGNANDRPRNPVRAIDTLQFRLLVVRGAWRRL